MGAQKQRAELIVYAITTCLTVTGTTLCLAGLLLPNWYNAMVLEGLVVVGDAHLGLWQDQICVDNFTCQTHWLSDSSYTRPHFYKAWDSWRMIQGFETAGTATALLSLLAMLPVWIFYKSSNRFLKNLTFSVFFVSSLISAFLSVIGCLIISSKENADFVSFAPLLSGIGGAVIFISVCLACIVRRYDPTYGTLENPVSPRFSRA